VATRFVINQTHPCTLAFFRYAIGTVCIFIPLMAAARVPFARRDLLPLSLLGIVQFGVVVALLNFALQFIPSGRAALIFATLPLQTMIIAAFFGYERLTLAKSVGVVLTVIGVGFVIGQNVFGEAQARGWMGDAAVFVSAFSAAFCSVLYRPYLQRYPTLQVSGFSMMASVFFLAVLAAREGLFSTLPHFTPGGWSAVLFIGISSGVGYYLWLWALNHTTPTRVTIFLALNPITAAGLGFLFLDEKVTDSLLIGIACVVLGLGAAVYGRSSS